MRTRYLARLFAGLLVSGRLLLTASVVSAQSWTGASGPAWGSGYGWGPGYGLMGHGMMGGCGRRNTSP
jgi:hypothetical protein